MNTSREQLDKLKRTRQRMRFYARLSGPTILYFVVYVGNQLAYTRFKWLYGILLTITTPMAAGTIGKMLLFASYKRNLKRLLNNAQELNLSELLALVVKGEEARTPELMDQISVRLSHLSIEEAQQLGVEQRESLYHLLSNCTHLSVRSLPGFLALTIMDVLSKAEDIRAIPAIRKLHQTTLDRDLKQRAQEVLDLLGPLAAKARTGETLLRPATAPTSPDTLLRPTMPTSQESDEENLLRASNSPGN